MDRDEPSLRRPEFRGGVPITLGDGRPWTFPPPELDALCVTLDGDGRPTVAPASRFGAAYDDLVDAYLEAEPGLGELTALAALAVDLLGRNYALEPRDYRRLLRFVPGESPEGEASRAMWHDISGVALGRGPKGPTASGSGPPSPPTA